MKQFFAIVFACAGALFTNAQPPNIAAAFYNIKNYGATGNGAALDTKSINETIEAASKNGGGTVFFPAGNYLCGSIHLKSNITLYLDNGAMITAAPGETSDYDMPENKIDNMYEDFGHRHWHNSLIWGENLHDVAIIGQGTIFGKGLERMNKGENDTRPNKSISLYNCRNVLIRDVTLSHAGWFGLLATGVDHLTVENVIMDTNRDGMDIDCCQDVKIANCSINSPLDDAIVLKSSYGLGFARSTKNVMITNCEVSGFEEGSFLDKTYKQSDNKRPTGRIKMGTESNGGFQNITISNCVFNYCGGLALETVDGAQLEDVTVNNITMRDVVNAPIFLRLGARMRGPENAPVGVLRRVIIGNVVAWNVNARTGAIISGIPGHNIEDVSLHDIDIYYQGGINKTEVAKDVPGLEKEYPEPGRFGVLPSYGFYIRNADGIRLQNIDLHLMSPDQRPAFVLDSAKNVTFRFVNASSAKESGKVSLRNSANINFFQSLEIKDTTLANAADARL